jgi:AhpD family alkylhydroperoxidase
MQRLKFWRYDNDGIRALMSVNVHLARSGLEQSLLDLVYLRVSQLIGCSACVDARARKAIDHGLEQGQVDAVATWRERAFFDDRQRAALAWAETLTDVARSGVPDDVYAEAAGHFSEAEFVDLTLAIALSNAFARVGVAFNQGPPPEPALAKIDALVNRGGV